MSPLFFLALTAMFAALGAIAARGIDPRRWPRAAVAALAVGIYGHFAANRWAIIASIALVAAGVILPALTVIAVRRRSARGDLAGAARRARLLGLFRPSWRGWADVWAAADAFAAGDAAPVTALAASLAARDDALARAQSEALLGLTRDWARARFAHAVDLQSRALCELCEVEAGVETAARVLRPRMRPGAIRRVRGVMLAPFAFTGDVSTTDRLTALMGLGERGRELWRATAQAAAGEADEARRLLDELLARPDLPPTLRHAAEQRRAALPGPVWLGASAQAVLADARREVDAGWLLRVGPLARAPVTVGVLALMAVGFVLQHLSGGVENEATARALGALIGGRLPADPWRLLAYGFLHFGGLHLSANALAIGFVGPLIERALGHLGMALVFFGGVVLAGLGICAFGAPTTTVGASGGAMALISALLVIAALHPASARTRTGRGAVWLGVVVIGAQSAVDAALPMISSAGHLAGGAAGLALAAVWLKGVGAPALK